MHVDVTGPSTPSSGFGTECTCLMDGSHGGSTFRNQQWEVGPPRRWRESFLGRCCQAVTPKQGLCPRGMGTTLLAGLSLLFSAQTRTHAVCQRSCITVAPLPTGCSEVDLTMALELLRCMSLKTTGPNSARRRPVWMLALRQVLPLVLLPGARRVFLATHWSGA